MAGAIMPAHHPQIRAGQTLGMPGSCEEVRGSSIRMGLEYLIVTRLHRITSAKCSVSAAFSRLKIILTTFSSIISYGKNSKVQTGFMLGLQQPPYVGYLWKDGNKNCLALQIQLEP
jgi:hypothetical protein